MALRTTLTAALNRRVAQRTQPSDHRLQGGVMWRIAFLAVTSGLALALAAAPAQAVITEPIPADVPAGPPPIPSLPAAGETVPPADAISDPVEPDAGCGGWYQQSSYAGIWPAGSSWWEYECILAEVIYPSCTGMPGQCDAGYWEIGSWTDRYYWDGSRAVFYGEHSQYGCDLWWDAPTARWYRVEPFPCPSATAPENAAPAAGFTVDCSQQSCSFDGSGSTDSDGTIQAYSWALGDGATVTGKTTQHTYTEAGFYAVKLTVTDDQGATDTVTKTVTIEPPPPPNAAPTASISFDCAGLSCNFNGGGSSDSDGTIQAYGWDLGDGSSGSGKTAQHSYAQAGSYTAKLTVTDDDGATGTASKAVTLIGLTARGYKVKGLQRVDLSWNGGAGTGFDVYRDGQKVATAAGSSYTDNPDRKGSGSYSYKVCQTASPICSNQTAVTF